MVLVFRGISCFLCRFLYFERKRPTASTRQPRLMYLSTRYDARPRERSYRGRFLPLGRKASSYRGAYRVPLFIRLSVCMCVCDTEFVVFDRLRDLCEADFHKPVMYGSGRAWANAWGVGFRAPSRGGRSCWADVGFVVCFRWGGIFSCSP